MSTNNDRMALNSLSKNTGVSGLEDTMRPSIMVEVHKSIEDSGVYSEASDDSNKTLTVSDIIPIKPRNSDNWGPRSPLRKSATNRMTSASKVFIDVISSKAAATYTRASSFGSRRGSIPSGKVIIDAIASKAAATYTRASSFGSRKGSFRNISVDSPSPVAAQSEKPGHTTSILTSLLSARARHSLSTQMSTNKGAMIVPDRKALKELSENTDVFASDDIMPSSKTEEIQSSTRGLQVYSGASDDSNLTLTASELSPIKPRTSDNSCPRPFLRRSATSRMTSASKVVIDAIASKAATSYTRASSFGSRRGSFRNLSLELPFDVVAQNNKTGPSILSRTMSSSSTEEFCFAIPDSNRTLKVYAEKLTKSTKKDKLFFLDSRRRLLYWRPTQKYGKIDILNIQELRFGQEAVAMNDKLKVPTEKEDLIISITFLPTYDVKDSLSYLRYRTTNILLPNKDEFETWKAVLLQLIRKKYNPFETIQDLASQQYPKCLNAENLFKITHECRLHVPKFILQGYLHLVAPKSEIISSTQLQQYLNAMQARPELQLLFDAIRTSEFGISIEDWAKTVDQKYESRMLEDIQFFNNKDYLDFSAFKKFLKDIGSSTHSQKDDMTHPLSHYYASSSHNTYLVASQITGDSTVDGYIRTLLRGCRVIEIDIHNGDPFPVVHHRRSMTTSISLEHVCQAIKRYAFEISDWPVVISAEIHCNDQQQGCIADIMQRVFGNILVSEPLGKVDDDQEDYFPSPNDLRGRILLKGKNRSLEIDDEDGSSFTQTSDLILDSSFTGPILSPKTEKYFTNNSHTNIPTPSPTQSASCQRSSSTTHSRRMSTESIQTFKTDTPPQVSTNMINFQMLDQESLKSKKSTNFEVNPQLASLFVYTVGVKCKGFTKGKKYNLQQVVSLGENAADKYVSTSMSSLVEHNTSHIVRCYPAANRLFSSNPDPIQFWNAGCQWVALNWQTNGLPMSINTAMFKRNQGSGYCLKPNYLRSIDSYRKRRIVRNQLRIKIVSAQNLLVHPGTLAAFDPSIDTLSPYVSVRLHGTTPLAEGSTDAKLRPDGNGHNYRTRAVKNNTLNPCWNEECSFQFVTIDGGQDMVFLRFSVGGCDSEDQFNSGFTISLGSIRQGWQHLGLEDSSGNPCTESYLFVYLELLTY